MQKPTVKPVNPCFSSGPCAKRPGWHVSVLENALGGRSHRSKPAKERIKQVLDLTRDVLNIPDDYVIGLTAASDTGAIEMAMWNMLGPRGVDIFAWDVFGKDWVTDVTQELKLPDVRTFVSPFGELPDLTQADWTRDVVFTWNGTTGGVMVPDGDWIPDDREGLSILRCHFRRVHGWHSVV